ncbi:SDR family oxidoreductase [Paraburkholderia unamae]|uniref:SDR family oxidoreductase n=1 Tax=Paraburkholderia unamae TaxID=219649 RepID=UPI00283AAE3F|nr:SDR family NAD(P)-dependent oxidoreductase [Paraburkholderia unamae]
MWCWLFLPIQRNMKIPRNSLLDKALRGLARVGGTGIRTNMARRFENKVVAITGGSEGIGLASARLFADEGAKVYITGRRQTRLDEAVEEIGNGAVGVQGDASNLADLDRLYDRIQRDNGRLDVVLGNASRCGMRSRSAVRSRAEARRFEHWERHPS